MELKSCLMILAEGCCLKLSFTYENRELKYKKTRRKNVIKSIKT